MNHQKVHDQIIEKFRGLSKQEVRDAYGYSENHHVKPSFQKGSDEDFNRVHLPMRYHFVVHRLLSKLEPDDYRHWSTIRRMAYSKKLGIKVTSRMSETLRANLARLGRSEETKEKISESLTGRKLGPHSDEHRRKIAESHTGKKLSEAHAKGNTERLIEINKNRVRSAEENASRGRAISNALKAKGPREVTEAQELGRKVSSEKRKGTKRSQETKDKMKESWKKRRESGIGNGLQGKSRSEITKKKISETISGSSFSDSHREALSLAQSERRRREFLAKR